jgi:plastocyanin
MSTRQPISETHPQLVYGLAIMLFVFAVFGAAMYVLADVVAPSEAAVTETDSGGPVTPGGATTLTLVAKNLAFDKRTITAAAGGDVTITLDNQDAGVSHNVSFYTNKNATSKIYLGDLTAGPAKKDEKFKAPSAPGNYFFRCDAHPDQMTGTFAVK